MTKTHTKPSRPATSKIKQLGERELAQARGGDAGTITQQYVKN